MTSPVLRDATPAWPPPELAQAGHQAAGRPYFHAPTCTFRGLEPRNDP